MNEISERIRMIRRGVSRDEFAARLGISPTTLKRYETGERKPDPDFLETLISDQKISRSWLLTGEGSVFADGAELSPGEPVESGLFSERKPEETAKDELIVALRENASLQRENGDLRVENERLRARTAELERQLAEVLKPQAKAASFMDNGAAAG